MVKYVVEHELLLPQLKVRPSGATWVTASGLPVTGNLADWRQQVRASQR